MVLPKIKNLISSPYNYKIEICGQYFVMVIVLYKGNQHMCWSSYVLHPIIFQNEDRNFLLILQIISISGSGAEELYYILCVSSINIKNHYLKNELEGKKLIKISVLSHYFKRFCWSFQSVALEGFMFVFTTLLFFVGNPHYS